MGKRASERSLGDNAAMASVRKLRVSPQKLNLVAQQIRGMNCAAALDALQFSHRRIAVDVRKLLLSAIANAENNHQLDVDRLYVSEASVGKTMIMKRWRARARGRSARIQKPFSNLRVVVSERDVSGNDDAKGSA